MTTGTLSFIYECGGITVLGDLNDIYIFIFIFIFIPVIFMAVHVTPPLSNANIGGS